MKKEIEYNNKMMINKNNNLIKEKNNIILDKRLICMILVAVWMVIVFCFSGEEGKVSKVTSGNTIEHVVTLVNKDIPEPQLNKIVENLQPIGRKIAHFSLYTIGGFLIYLLVDCYMISRKSKLLLAFVIGVLYAITDEMHQIFVPERCGRVFDVFIDSCGVVTGILLINIILLVLNRVKNKKDVVKNNNNNI